MMKLLGGGPDYEPDSYSSNFGSVPASIAYNNRGFYYYKKGEYELAIANLKEALRLYNEQIELDPHSNPDFAMMYLNLGSAYYAKKDYNMAIEHYDNVVRLCPNYVKDFINSNFAHGGQEEVDRAIELLDKVIEDYYNSENWAVAAYYSGVSILFNGNKHKARRRFETAHEWGFEDDAKITEHLENLRNRE